MSLAICHIRAICAGDKLFQHSFIDLVPLSPYSCCTAAEAVADAVAGAGAAAADTAEKIYKLTTTRDDENVTTSPTDVH